MTTIRLLSTDFDGTLIGHPSDGRCVASLAVELQRHHEAGGQWAVNTGRTLEHALEGVALFSAPVEPDFLLTNEREVFRRRPGGGWESFGEWNDDCYRKHGELFGRSGLLLAEIEKMAEDSPEISLLHENGLLAGLVTASEDVMDVVAAEISRAALGVPEFGFQRNTVYMRFCHREYHKGAALGELCRLIEIPVEEVFAAGDHFNDLSMLDGIYAGATACPANAIEPVKAAVRLSGGYVAENAWGDGIAEALAYFRGKSAAKEAAILERAG